ncbi:hypothetical protein [Mesorhizobium sp. KR1-2]|uniref:hypothetical protein n=1 Tax=Mesorhizobium sp. KR1-2 TaxID=3156609 RepID=UPI0032B5BEFA
MDRIRTSTAVADLFGVGKPGFTDGDPIGGILATWLNAAWFNQVQEELCNFIEEAGLQLDPASRAQLGKAAARYVQSGKWTYAVATGTANALVVALAPAVTQYTPGMTVRVKAAFKNTGAVTLDAGAGAAPVRRPSGSPLVGNDLAKDGVYTFVFDGVSWVAAQLEPPLPLAGDVTLFVRTNGSDANDGGADTAARAFRTIQYAVDYAITHFVGRYRITIRVADGVYAPFVVSGSPNLDIEVLGNRQNLQNVEIRAAATDKYAVYVTNFARLKIDGVRLEGGNENLLVVGDQALINIGSIRLGACPQYHIFAIDGGVISTVERVEVTGSAQSFLTSAYGRINSNDCTVQFSAGLTFSNVVFASGGTISLSNVSFPGATPTGRRYTVQRNSMLFTGGGGANYIPGTTAGVTTQGGTYY